MQTKTSFGIQKINTKSETNTSRGLMRRTMQMRCQLSPLCLRNPPNPNPAPTHQDVPGKPSTVFTEVIVWEAEGAIGAWRNKSARLEQDEVANYGLACTHMLGFALQKKNTQQFVLMTFHQSKKVRHKGNPSLCSRGSRQGRQDKCCSYFALTPPALSAR